jgi:hypothetical protein
MVEDNRVGHSMKFEDIIHENLSHGGCCEMGVGGHINEHIWKGD